VSVAGIIDWTRDDLLSLLNIVKLKQQEKVAFIYLSVYQLL